MSPAVRLRHLYVTSEMGLRYFDRLTFVVQGVQDVQNVAHISTNSNTVTAL
jgi:hypothetical protein